MVKARITAHPQLHLALAKAAFKTSGEFDTSIHQFEAKPSHEQTFANFWTFIVPQFSKEHIQKQTAKSVGFWVANSIQSQRNKNIPDDNATKDWLGATAGLVYAMQAASEKKMEQFMTMVTDMLKAIQDLLAKMPN